MHIRAHLALLTILGGPLAQVQHRVAIDREVGALVREGRGVRVVVLLVVAHRRLLAQE